MIKISVIVPVYNVEKYLDKCLTSLVNQTLNEIEIIIVNDGSTDNSINIIKKYEKKYKNIKAFNKKNGGLSDARNFGLKKATGQYIAFLDSDDYITFDMYEKMYNKAKSGNFDIVVCDLNYIFDNKTKKAFSNIKIDTYDIKKTMLDIYPAAWNKIFKKELFDYGVTFKKNVWYEDVEFIYKLIPYVKSIGVVHEHLHQYVQRQGSIMTTYDERIYHYIDNWNGIINFYKNKNIYNEYKNELEYCYVRYIYATFIKQATRLNLEDFDKAVSIAIKNVKENFPSYRTNKYFYSSLKGIYLILFNKFFARLLYVKNNLKLNRKIK